MVVIVLSRVDIGFHEGLHQRQHKELFCTLQIIPIVPYVSYLIYKWSTINFDYFISSPGTVTKKPSLCSYSTLTIVWPRVSPVLSRLVIIDDIYESFSYVIFYGVAQGTEFQEKYYNLSLEVNSLLPQASSTSCVRVSFHWMESITGCGDFYLTVSALWVLNIY